MSRLHNHQGGLTFGLRLACGSLPIQVWDRLECERQRDMTLDLHDRACQTNKFRWTVVDVPGHRRYLRNTLTGALLRKLCTASNPQFATTGVSR